LRNHASIYRSTQVAEGAARSDSFPKMEADFATDFLRHWPNVERGIFVRR
jgi:hypothetical protein